MGTSQKLREEKAAAELQGLVEELALKGIPYPEDVWEILPNLGIGRVTKVQEEILRAGEPTLHGGQTPLFKQLSSQPLLSEQDVCQLIQWKYWPFYWTWQLGFCIEEEMLEIQRLRADIEAGVIRLPVSPSELKRWASRAQISLPPDFTGKRVLPAKPPKGRQSIRHSEEVTTLARVHLDSCGKPEAEITPTMLIALPAIAAIKDEGQYTDETMKRWVRQAYREPRPRGRPSTKKVVKRKVIFSK